MRHLLVRLSAIATFLCFAAAGMIFAIGASSGLALTLVVAGPTLFIAALVIQALYPDVD